MPNGKITFTGKIGPGRQLTSQVFDNVKRLEWDFVNQTLNFVLPAPSDKPVVIDYSGITTVTVSISGGVTSLTLS